MVALHERLEHAGELRGVLAVALEHHLSATQRLEQRDDREEMVDDEEGGEQAEHVVVDAFGDGRVPNEEADDRVPDGIERDEHERNESVLVKQGEIGHRWKQTGDRPAEHNGREQECT